MPLNSTKSNNEKFPRLNNICNKLTLKLKVPDSLCIEVGHYYYTVLLSVHTKNFTSPWGWYTVVDIVTPRGLVEKNSQPPISALATCISAFISLLQEIRINMHEPGSKTTTSTTGRAGGSSAKIPYHGSNQTLYYHPYNNRAPPNTQQVQQQQPPRHRVLAGGAILQPSSQNNHHEEMTLLNAPIQGGLPHGGPSHSQLPPNPQNNPQIPCPQQIPHPIHQVQQQQQCKKNLQKMMGISPSDIDKYSRIFFPVSFTCFNLMYWIIYLHVSDEVADNLVLLNG